MEQEQSMAQQQMQSTKPQPAQNPTGSFPMIDEKRLYQKWWFWLIVLIIIGFGVYYLFF